MCFGSVFHGVFYTSRVCCPFVINQARSTTVKCHFNYFQQVHLLMFVLANELYYNVPLYPCPCSLNACGPARSVVVFFFFFFLFIIASVIACVEGVERTVE